MVDLVDDPILTTVKVALGRSPEQDPFDGEILTFINSSISTATQLGVGPREGLVIDKDTPWSSLLQGRTDLENVKAYIFMKVKMLHDSGSMSQQLITSYEKMIAEQEGRIVIATDPNIPQMLPVEDPVEEV